jgi:hypothetical protein
MPASQGRRLNHPITLSGAGAKATAQSKDPENAVRNIAFLGILPKQNEPRRPEGRKQSERFLQLASSRLAI